MSEAAELLVVDASALVDLLAGTEVGPAVKDRLAGCVLHAPAHIDAEVLSTLGRLHRANQLTGADVDRGLALLATMPLTRHAVVDLAAGAWGRRADLRLVDALYVELAAALHTRLLTTDFRLARASALAETVGRSDS